MQGGPKSRTTGGSAADDPLEENQAQPQPARKPIYGADSA